MSINIKLKRRVSHVSNKILHGNCCNLYGALANCTWTRRIVEIVTKNVIISMCVLLQCRGEI